MRRHEAPQRQDSDRKMQEINEHEGRRLKAEYQQLSVLIHELQTLPPGKRVFEQKTNVPVYFLEDQRQLLAQTTERHRDVASKQQAR